MYNISGMVLVLTVCDLAIGFLLGVMFCHYYPEYVAFLFR